MWKDIPGYENLYEINENGEIRNKKRKNILKPCINKKGYLKISLSKNNKHFKTGVHRLVALTFISNPNNYTNIVKIGFNLDSKYEPDDLVVPNVKLK